MRKSVVLSILLIALLLISGAVFAEDLETYPNSELLVNVEWLADNMARSDVRVVDMRDADAYGEAHIPGAANVPVDAISSTINGISMEFDEEEVQTAFNEIGLMPEMTVVIYDNLGMMSSARLFWTLEYVGHDDVRILNGGWNAWVAAEQATSSDTPTFETTEYPIDIHPQKLVTANEIMDVLNDPDVIIVDARSPEEYTGEVAFADRGGHIPGAVRLTWLEALTEGDAVFAVESDWVEQLRDEDVEMFLPAEEIQTLLEENNITPDKRVITYCQTFWRGAHVYFLLRLMGFEDVQAYDGSWSEWGNRTDLPVVTGSQPFGDDAESQ